MHVRFSAPFNYTPPTDRRTTTRYPAGFDGVIKRAHGEAAIAAGKAEEIPTPPRVEAPAVDSDAGRG